MMVQRIASTALIVGWVLALGAATASADHGHRGRHDARDGRLLKLAYKLERATDELYCDAYTQVREHRRYGRRGLASLRHLDRQARAFRAQLERGSLHDRRTQREFRRLEHAYRDATRRVPDRLARRHLDDELARVERLIDRIDRRLEVSLARARDHRDDWRRGDRFAYRQHDDRFRITWSFGY